MAGLYPYSEPTTALAVVAGVISDALYDPDSFEDMPDSTVRCHLNGTFLGHKVLDALVEFGYCATVGPAAQVQEHPSCWVRELAKNDLYQAYYDAKSTYENSRDFIRNNGSTQKGAAGGVIKSPHHAIMRDAVDTMIRLSEALGGH